VHVIKPAVGDSESGFASHLEQFDSLVDTLGNERTSLDNQNNVRATLSLGESTLQMLQSRHKCHNYVSTLTHSQNIVTSEGLLAGPRKADGYSEQVGNPSSLTKSHESQSINPPKAIGSTLETLMENGVILTEKQRSKACSKKSDAIRGWSLSDFWELMSWPRDSSGIGTTRFGLPVKEVPDDLDEDEDSEDGFMISEAPYDGPQSNRRVNRDDADANDDDDDVGDFELPSSLSSSKNRAVQNNPYVLSIMDIAGLQSEIDNDKKTCIMFMSAKFCKTCKTINPAFTRMARVNQEKGDSSSKFSFVKAETSGASGKELAKHLSVRAVPSFVFFREGKILGQTYVSKLPSLKITQALQLLESGAEWDYSLLDDDE